MTMENRVCRREDAQGKKKVENWGSLTWFADKSILETTGLTVGRVVINKGMANPRHIHPNCEEVLYLLSGKLEHTLGDEKITLNAGDAILIPAGIAHNAVSVGDVDADMVVSYSSADRQVVG